MKTLKNLGILFSIVALSISCSSDNQFTAGDLQEEDQIKIIKFNFLERYGGIEMERKKVVSFIQGNLIDCDSSIFYYEQLTFPDQTVDYTYNGHITLKCKYNDLLKNDHFYRYDNDGSTGQGKEDDLEIHTTNNARVSIAGEKLKNEWSIHSITSRNIRFVGEPFHSLQGHISLRSINCMFNFQNGNYIDDPTYLCSLTITDKHSSSHEVIRLNGTIQKVNDLWTYIDEAGKEYPLE